MEMMKRHSLDDEMTTVALDESARTWARALEEKEAARSGIPLRKARASVARRMGLSPGTLENLRNGRMKRVTAWCFERIRAATIRELQREIARCTHELEIARQCGLDPRSAEMAALETAVSKALNLMGEPQ